MINWTLEKTTIKILSLIFVIGCLFLIPSSIDHKQLTAESEVQAYTIDPVHTSVLFRVKHAGIANFYGRFIDVEGDVQYSSSNPDKNEIKITIASDSVKTWSEKRDNHLKSPDFFNVKEYPEISFKSTKIEPGENDTYQVTGMFSLHGVKKKITVEARKTGEGEGPEGNQRIGFETKFSIKRSNYDMNNYMSAIGDDVTIILSIEAVKKTS